MVLSQRRLRLWLFFLNINKINIFQLRKCYTFHQNFMHICIYLQFLLLLYNMSQIYSLPQPFFLIFLIAVLDDEVEIYPITHGVFVHHVDTSLIPGAYTNAGIWFELLLNALKCFTVTKLTADYIKKCLVLPEKLIHITWYDQKKLRRDFIYFT